MRYSSPEKRLLVFQYYNAKSARELCLQSKIAKSTFYNWVKAYCPIEPKRKYRMIIPIGFDTFLRCCEK